MDDHDEAIRLAGGREQPGVERDIAVHLQRGQGEGLGIEPDRLARGSILERAHIAAAGEPDRAGLVGARPVFVIVRPARQLRAVHAPSPGEVGSDEAFGPLRFAIDTGARIDGRHLAALDPVERRRFGVEEDPGAGEPGQDEGGGEDEQYDARHGHGLSFRRFETRSLGRARGSGLERA